MIAPRAPRASATRTRFVSSVSAGLPGYWFDEREEAQRGALVSPTGLPRRGGHEEDIAHNHDWVLAPFTPASNTTSKELLLKWR
jgi:hypothetical protein